MTNREFLNAIATNETLSEEVRNEAVARIEKMDAALNARKNKPSKKTTENAPILESLREILTTEARPASVIAEEAGISIQKASALLRQLVASKHAVVTEIKVPKKGAQKAYSAPETAVEDAE